MKYHIRFKDLIIFSGDKKAITDLFNRNYIKFGYYELITDQTIKEESWEF
jgi:hypothetical protein